MAGPLISPGAFNLGAVLAGGGRIREQAKNAEELRMIQLAQTRAETDRKVDQAVEEAAKRRGVQGVENDDTIPQLIRNLTVGGLGTDYSGATQGQLHQQEADNRAAAVTAALAGNMPNAQAHLMGVANGPVTLAKVEGNTVLNPLVQGGGPLQTTDVGRALIGATDALTTQRNASANLSNVKAAGGGFAPSRAGAGGKAGKYTTPAHAALVDAFSGSGTDEADFLRWRQAHPEITNGNVALDQYRLERASHGPHIITPSLPGSMTQAPPSQLDVPLEASLRADGAPPDVVARVAAAADSGKDFNIPAGPVPAAAAPIVAALAGQTPAPIPGSDKVGDVLRKARAAVHSGADPEAVRARLIKAGYKHIAGRI